VHGSPGCKTLAQLSAAYNLLEHAEFVTLLDDDTLLPEEWNIDQIIGLFMRDPGVQCVAYPLRAANRNTSLCQMEDIEYLVAGFMKVRGGRVAPLPLLGPAAHGALTRPRG